MDCFPSETDTGWNSYQVFVKARVVKYDYNNTLDEGNEKVVATDLTKNFPNNPEDYIHSDNNFLTHYNTESAMEFGRTHNTEKKEEKSEEEVEESTQ